jgi:O-antigen ligase
MTINMFITGGRAGQVMFFAMIAIIIFQFFNTQKIKALFLISFLIPGIFFTAYTTSDLFQERVDAAVKNSLFYSENKASSVGLRITFALNSWEAIKKNPIIGVGTGDFPIEYKKINKINTPGLPNTTNPHNMYVLVAMELGALGVISMLSIFYYQIKLSFNSSNKFIRDFGITLPLLFLVIMCSDSYLLGHYTTLIFVFFSSFLYKDFEKF